MKPRWLPFAWVAGLTATAHAQDAPAPAAPVQVQVTPGSSTTTSQSSIFGPAPATIGDVNSYLPSSSQASTDTSSSSDGFDLNRFEGGSPVVRGGENGAYVVQGQYVPDSHTARRGDTLTRISQKYYGNPYNWPQIWAQNRQIQNPHWIYPGDQIRLRGNYGVKTVNGFIRPAPVVSPNTYFQRHYGYVLDGEPKPPTWGEVIGAPDDQMLLSAHDQLYIKLQSTDAEGARIAVEVGDELLLFEPRRVKNAADFPLVWIRGVAQVNRYNPKTGMVRAEITESLTTVERGVRVGPINRKIDVVAPVRNEKTIEAKIVGALYPHAFYSQGQFVFIDKGSKAGVRTGNRFFAVSRGDQWRRGLATAGRMGDDRAVTEDDRFAQFENTPDRDQPKLYPAETYAELIVLRVREDTATCLVNASIREIPRGAVIVAREGY